MTTITNATTQTLKKLVTEWAYTIVGAGGNLEEWVEGYEVAFREEGMGVPTRWYKFTGKKFNEVFEPVGTDRFPDDLVFLAFTYENMDVNMLSMFKLRVGDRWLYDVVANLSNKKVV